MNDVAELKRFVTVHARSQGIPSRRYLDLMAGISNDDGAGPGSWVAAWCQAGAELEQRGELLDACRYYNMARFPYIDGPARDLAHERCIAAFDRWRKDTGRIERLDVDLRGGRVRCWSTGLSQHERRPLFLVMGGIVSIKEQWAPVLLQARRLGMAGIVAEMPGVGENPLRYSQESWRMLPELIDCAADRADTEHTYAVTLSFSGHMALRAAASDKRIRGVITVGAPIRRFFTDLAWQQALPRITLDTLAHITKVGTGTDGLSQHLQPFELGPEQLGAVAVPVYYMASSRDEVIPPEDVACLRRYAADVRVIENDDVHGSPKHAAETRIWIVRSLLRLSGGGTISRAALAALFHLRRAASRSRLAVGGDEE